MYDCIKVEITKSDEYIEIRTPSLAYRMLLPALRGIRTEALEAQVELYADFWAQALEKQIKEKLGLIKGDIS